MTDFSQLKKFKEKLLMPFKPKGKSKEQWASRK
jgi:hypothetical protein